MNYFGSFKQQKFTIKSLKIQNFRALRELHILSLDFEMEDLLKLLSGSNVNSMSFTITTKHEKSSDIKCSYAYFNKLEYCHLEYKANPYNTLFKNLIENMTNIQRLEIKYLTDINVTSQKFFFDLRRISNKFECLKHLRLGENIRFVLDKENLIILERLKYWNFNVNLNYYIEQREDMRQNYIYLTEKTKKINLLKIGGIDQSKLLITQNTVYGYIKKVSNFRLVDSYFNSNLYEKLNKFEFSSSRQNILLMDSLNSIDLINAKYLVVLDMRHVHLHSNKGFGEAFSNLECNFFRI